MAGIQPPQLKSIEELFSGDTQYSVPLYQRDYAWTEDETGELWEDVLLAANRNSDYFLGTIVLQQVEPKKLDIIDGQQRLASLTMIFSAIRHYFKSQSDKRETALFERFIGKGGLGGFNTPRL